MLRPTAFRTAALLPFLAIPALAQYSISKIAIQGAAPYTEAEVLQVSGLQPGQRMTHNSLADAAQHLLNTGVFADAEVSLAGAGLARTVVIDLKPLPANSLAPASFTNLVWWTPAELDAQLRQRVPFYRGGIPPAGNLSDSVNAALTAMLATKGIHATVSNAPVQPTDDYPQLTWQFSIDNPSVRLASVHLTGTPPTLASAMQRSIDHATYSPYNEGLSGQTLEDLLLAPLRNAGYLDAKLTNASRTVAPASSDYAVSYSATVEPGEPFRIATLTWQSTPIYSADAFTHDAKLHASDLASQHLLLATEQSIVNAYLHLGYLDAYIDAHPQQNSSTHTISYTLQIVPGEIYRLQTITPLNLSPAARKDFDFGWQLKPGAPYDPLYAASFLTKNTALRNLAGYTAAFQAAADPQTHLVDLTIDFIRTGQ
jgi:outer membrane protein insertion porin family